MGLKNKKACPEQRRRVVCIGGGTGVSTILSGLKDTPCELSAIVTMFDNGGSSGKLSKTFNILPPGDVRQCLIATSDNKYGIKEFCFRFDKGDLKGHNLGNLKIVRAVEEENGDWNKAISALSEELAVKAKIYPVTLERSTIKVVLNNKKKVAGEEEIINCKDVSKVGVKKIFLEPKVKANPKAITALKEADLIIVAPGKFYTSIMPNFLVDGIVKAIKNSKAKKAFICNLMTQEGNTDNFSVEDFVDKFEDYIGSELDYVIFNTEKLALSLMKKVKEVFPKTEFIKYNNKLLKEKKFIGKKLIDKRIRCLNPADVLVKGANQRTIVFHDSKKLAKVILNLCKQ